MEINKKIRNLRKKLNYSQQKFSDKIEISRSVLSQIEINKLKPSVDIIARIAKEFNISISYFFENDLELTDQNDYPLVRETSEKYDNKNCPLCKQLKVVNDIQKDVIHSLEKTISTQFQLIELLEKRIEVIKDTMAEQPDTE